VSDNLYPRKKQGLKIKPIPAPLRITIIYLLVGFIWIILSDYILLGLAVDKINLTAYQTLKGVGYVSITAMMLYLLIRKDYIALKRSKQDLKQSYDATLKG
jgi:multidrug transporter EmrE-like cation transporter